MKQELLCTWLGLPKTCWPPDPWTLLGLTREDRDLAVIEQRVQICMCKLRSYQLSYPEEATEGMNRLAEAFIALAEANSKCAAPAIPSKPATPKPAASKDETTIIHQTKLDWRDEPPPVRGTCTETPDAVEEEDSDTTEILIAQPFVAPPRPHCREIDAKLVRDLGRSSDEATSDVGTLDAVIQRVEITRRLLHAWEKVGRLLKSNNKKISAKENEQLARRFDEIAKIMSKYPAFIGHPGKPGYRVVVLARLRIPLLIIRSMSDEQRDDLRFDWEVGRQVLLEHRKFLRSHFESLRQRTTVGLMWYAARAFVNDYPWQTLVGALVTILFAAMLGTWFATR